VVEANNGLMVSDRRVQCGASELSWCRLAADATFFGPQGASVR